jgi:hypothetical protein
MLGRLAFSLVVVLCAQNSALAEQVGTTPDGNVIYRFTCHTPSPDVTVHWPNHVGHHPKWEYAGGPGIGVLRAELTGISRGGQVLTCNFKVLLGGELRGTMHYRYEVHRHIISCQSNGVIMTCILDAGGGGQSSSSLESSSPLPEKCIGLGCKGQPNPSGCIGMGCEKRSEQQPGSP